MHIVQQNGQDVFLHKNSDGSFKYINKVGGAGGAGFCAGNGYGFSYILTNDNGSTTTVIDDHWITAGGGGGSSGGYTEYGATGTSWYGGWGGSATSKSWGAVAGGGLGGGMIVCIGSSIKGEGWATAGAKAGNTASAAVNGMDYKSSGGGGRRWMYYIFSSWIK